MNPACGESLVSPGISTCAGCGMELALRIILAVLGSRTIVVIPPGCAALFSGTGRESGLQVPGYQCTLETTACSAAGVRAGFEAQGIEDINVLAFAGDGGTIDIGLQALSGVMERGERIIYVCYDNEAYMNTGIQASGSTPFGAFTTTTPGGKPVPRKDMMQIVAAHRIPYAATASVAHVEDFRKKVQKAKACGGTAYLHVLATCPTGWFFEPEKSVDLARLAVQSLVWPLFEVINGTEYRITHTVSRPVPAHEYLKPQGRFFKMTDEQLAQFEREVERDYAALVQRVKNSTVAVKA